MTEDAVTVAARMKAEDMTGPHDRTGPMCGPHKADPATIEKQRLLADAILLERAATALKRRYPPETIGTADCVVDPVTYSDLRHVASAWRREAEREDPYPGRPCVQGPCNEHA